LIITKDSFEALLEWLDPDRDEAALRFEQIRGGLVRMFASKGLMDAEFYADQTVDRVIKRLPEIRETYTDEPVKYFHGVARFILLEAARRREIPTDILPECLPRVGAVDTELAGCLRKCLKSLPKEKHALIHDYHVYDGHEKIDSHREMADELSITIGALRTRAHHVRATLEACVRKCMNLSRNESAGEGHNSSGANNERHNK
jgi:DNA-directed RNA polymerase specialized sigma24 family protein